MSSPLLIRGAAEAHRGAPWSWAARERMIRYLGELGFNLYLYAPHGEPLIRDRWWEPYLRDEVDAFVDMAQVGARRGVNFCCALEPAVPDLPAVVAKLKPLYEGGLRHFGLLAHAGSLCRLVLAALPGITLYASPEKALPPEVEVLVPSGGPSVTVADAEQAGRCYGRPPLLWDRFPCSDYTLHLRPVRGRAPGLSGAAAGIVVEAGPLPEAARVPLYTWAMYLRNPGAYDPERAWVQALAHVAGEAAPALRLLGEITRNSFFEEPAVAFPPGLTDHRSRLEAWARAAGVLKAVPDKPLREDLKPWITKLALSADAGLKALAALDALPAQAGRLRGQALSALWRLREQPAWVAGDQVERYVRDWLRHL